MSEITLITNSENHSLTIGKETYSMTVIPQATMTLVGAEVQNVLQDLSLANLITDLDRAADLIYLAYNGVAGTGVLAASVSSRQKELGDLCGECVLTMTAFKQNTNDILLTIIDAYENLIDGEEETALDILAECSRYAKNMSDRCARLATGFDNLKKVTQADAVACEVAVGRQVEKLAELKKLRDEMNSTLAAQKKNSELLIERVEELKAQIAEEKENEEKEAERAFIGGIVSAIAGAVGSGLGAYVASQNPMTAVNKVLDTSSGKKETKSTDTKADAAAVAKAKEKKQADETAEKEAKAEQEAANRKLADATEALEAAEEAKNEAVAAKKKIDKKDTAAITAADDAIDKATEEFNKAKKDEKAAKKVADKAKEKSGAAEKTLAASAAVLTSLSESIGQMSEAAQKRADSIRQYRIALLSEKREQERLKRESLAQVAELNSKLQSNTDSQGVEQSTSDALEMAVWAFSNIYASLTNAKHFWDNMTDYCARLSEPQIVKNITREIKKDPEAKERRRKFYSSERFMQTAIFYLIRWKALNVICEGYVEQATKARTKVIDNIRKQPTIAEARAQLGQLKATLQKQLEDDKLASDGRSREIAEQQKLLTESKM